MAQGNRPSPRAAKIERKTRKERATIMADKIAHRRVQNVAVDHRHAVHCYSDICFAWRRQYRALSRLRETADDQPSQVCQHPHLRSGPRLGLLDREDRLPHRDRPANRQTAVDQARATRCAPASYCSRPKGKKIGSTRSSTDPFGVTTSSTPLAS